MMSLLKNNSVKSFLRISLKLLALTLVFYSLVVMKLGLFDRVPTVEWNFYQAYTKSIIEDRDLNILNNIPKDAAWVVSPTFNFPEMHDHGGPVLWAPIIAFFDLFRVEKITVAPNLVYSWDITANFVMNFLFFVLGISLLRQAFLKFSDKPLTRTAMTLIFLGTGLFYYTLVEYNGTETTLFFFVSLMLGYYSQISDDENWLFFLAMGILFAYGRIIKIHYLTYLLPFAYFYWQKNHKQPVQYHLKNVILFALGMALLILPMEYNNFLKYGFINLGQGYFDEFSWHSFFKLQDEVTTYFGPLGFFYSMPIFLTTFLFFLFGFFEWIRGRYVSEVEKVGIVLYSSVIAKLLLLQFVPTPGLCEFGGRNFIIDSSAQIVLMAGFLSRVENKKKKVICITILSLFAVWTLINYSWQNEIANWHPDQRMAHYLWSFDYIWKDLDKHWRRTVETIVHIHKFLRANGGLLIVSFFSALFLYNLRKITNVLSDKRKVGYVACFFLVLYLGTTGLNILNNQRNSEIMKNDPQYSKIMIGKGAHIFNYDNVATDLVPTMELDKFLKNKTEFEYKKKWFQNFLNEARKEIVSDHTGFDQALDEGRLPKIGVANEEDESSVLSYELPDRFKRKPVK